jgi:cell division septation protein DedD
MCVYLKKAVEKIYYRVQTGAFISKNKAEALAAQLAKDGFTDIWVRKIGNYWKVQLGAFSVRLNAERLADRLLAAGYQTYITTK